MAEPRRRGDDLVDAAGIPWSDAHQALWYKFVEEMDRTKVELIRAHEDMVQRHETNRHHPAFKEMFPDRQPQDIVIEVVDAASAISLFREDFDLLSDKALGTRKPDYLGGGRNEDGWDFKIDQMWQKFGNGTKLKVGIDWKDRVAVLIALIVIVLKQFGVI